MSRLRPDLKSLMMDNLDYDELYVEQEHMVSAAKGLLLYYSHEKIIKDDIKPLPVFRLSTKLASKRIPFYKAMLSLVGIEKTKNLIELEKKFNE